MPDTPKRPTQVDQLERLYHAVSEPLSPELARPEALTRLREDVAQALAATLGDAVELLAALEQELEASLASEEHGSELDLEFALDMTPLPGAHGGRQSITAGLVAHAANTCFAARGELRRAQRLLQRDSTAHDMLLSACESARRKLRRSISAVLESVAHLSGDESQLAQDQSAELEAAIAIRAMYAKFRRALVDCDENDARAVNRALRYAAVAIAKMVGSPEFSEVRLTDRTLLLSLQKRILRWARGAGDRNGMKLFKDICTAADLLSAINMRQELAQNDRRVVSEAAAALVGEPGREAFEQALRHLAALRGRDDAVDDRLDELAGAGFSDQRWTELRALVDSVAREVAMSAASQFS